MMPSRAAISLGVSLLLGLITAGSARARQPDHAGVTDTTIRVGVESPVGSLSLEQWVREVCSLIDAAADPVIRPAGSDSGTGTPL